MKYNQLICDFMKGRSMSMLTNTRQPREKFNPRNKKHLASLKVFLETNRWGEVQFELVPPFTSIPHMVLTMFAMSKLCPPTTPVALTPVPDDELPPDLPADPAPGQGLRLIAGSGGGTRC